MCDDELLVLSEKLAKAKSKSWYFKVSAADRFSYLCKHPPPPSNVNTSLIRESRLNSIPSKFSKFEDVESKKTFFLSLFSGNVLNMKRVFLLLNFVAETETH